MATQTAQAPIIAKKKFNGIVKSVTKSKRFLIVESEEVLEDTNGLGIQTVCINSYFVALPEGSEVTEAQVVGKPFGFNAFEVRDSYKVVTAV